MMINNNQIYYLNNYFIFILQFNKIVTIILNIQSNKITKINKQSQ